MKVYYPAIFKKEDDGRYSVSFPDIEEAITSGNNFQDAYDMAKECLGLCLVGRKEDNETTPTPNMENIKVKTKENEIVVAIEYDSIEFNKKYNKKSVRKNVTIPAWLCEIAKQKNINFSQTLQKALMEELNIS